MATTPIVSEPCASSEASTCAVRGRPRASSDAQRRCHLLQTAETVFLTSGYHAATMDDVARSAGMSKRTVYQVFGSKAELFEALLHDRFRPLTLDIEEDGRPIGERLSDVLRMMACFCLAPRQLAIIRLMISEGSQSRDMADAMERLGLGGGNTVLARLLAAEVARGTLREEPAHDAASALFFAVFGEMHLHALLRLGQPPTPDAIDRRIELMVPIFLGYAGAAV